MGDLVFLRGHAHSNALGLPKRPKRGRDLNPIQGRDETATTREGARFADAAANSRPIRDDKKAPTEIIEKDAPKHVGRNRRGFSICGIPR